MKKPPTVKLIYLEPRLDGGKVGLDDFFAAGGTVTTLIAQSTTTLRRLPEEEQDTDPLWPYEATEAGISMRKTVGNTVSSVPLTNFHARITADIQRDDGAEVQRFIEIEARLRNRSATKLISADRFAGMSWVTDLLGPQAILYPGQATKEHARVAIQKLSRDIVERSVYAHLGWRKINGQWVYLHADGAIGAEGAVDGIEVQVSNALAYFCLPAPPCEDTAISFIRKALRLLTVAPKAIILPGFAAVFRAPLGNTRFSLHYAGQTGLGKTELAALYQRFFGSEMDAAHLPANWSSTGNSLEGLAFEARDALLVVDDFAPGGAIADVQRYHKEADRLFRAQGNRSGRIRMRADGTLRSAKPPRGLILSTGEDVPRGHSIRARMLVIEVGPEDIVWSVLSQCQQDAADEVYAQVFATYIRWLASRYEDIRTNLAAEIERLRQQASADGQHKRTPDNVANLGVGLRFFLTFAREMKAISKEQEEVLWREGWNALLTAVHAQAVHHAASEPARRFLELLLAALGSGRGHIATPEGCEPPDSKTWGWRQKIIGTGNYEREEWQPQGERIGWLDGEALYLEPDTSFAVAQRLSKEQGESLPVTPQILRKRLKEKGFLASWDESRQTTTVRRVLEGKTVNVLHFSRDLIVNGLPQHKKPDKPDTNSSNTENREETCEEIPEKPDIGHNRLGKSDIGSTEESQTGTNSYECNVGNVRFSTREETDHKRPNCEEDSDRRDGVGNVGVSGNENRIWSPEDPTAVDSRVDQVRIVQDEPEQDKEVSFEEYDYDDIGSSGRIEAPRN